MGIIDRLRRLWGGKNEHSVELARGDHGGLELTRPQLLGLMREIERRSLTLQDTLPEGIGRAPQFTTFSKAAAVDDGLKASVYVYAATTVLARNAASVPWLAEQQQADGSWEHMPESSLQRLIDIPNEADSWSEFIQRVTYFMFLAGEAPISKIRSQAAGPSALFTEEDEEGRERPRGLPIAMWSIAPDDLDVIAGSSGDPFIIAYRSRIRGERVNPEDVLHPLFPNPADPYRGLGPLEVAQRDVDIEVEAGNWQKFSFQNRAVPDGVFKFGQVGGVDDAQWDAARAEFRAEYQASKNARTPLLLGLDVDFVKLASTAVEMDFINSKKLTRENIAAAFGVPPVMIGILDRATYSNFAIAEEVLWKLTLLPYMAMLQQLFTMQLAWEWGQDWRLRFDTSGVDALFPLFQRRVDTAIKLWGTGVPWDVLNERLKLGLPQFPGDDVGLVNAGLIPVATFVRGPPAPAEPAEPEEE
jgi:phage portal protein BeeE